MSNYRTSLRNMHRETRFSIPINNTSIKRRILINKLGLSQEIESALSLNAKSQATSKNSNTSFNCNKKNRAISPILPNDKAYNSDIDDSMTIFNESSLSLGNRSGLRSSTPVFEEGLPSSMLSPILHKGNISLMKTIHDSDDDDTGDITLYDTNDNNLIDEKSYFFRKANNISIIRKAKSLDVINISSDFNAIKDIRDLKTDFNVLKGLKVLDSGVNKNDLIKESKDENVGNKDENNNNTSCTTTFTTPNNDLNNTNSDPSSEIEEVTSSYHEFTDIHSISDDENSDNNKDSDDGNHHHDKNDTNDKNKLNNDIHEDNNTIEPTNIMDQSDTLNETNISEKEEEEEEEIINLQNSNELDKESNDGDINIKFDDVSLSLQYMEPDEEEFYKESIPNENNNSCSLSIEKQSNEPIVEQHNEELMKSTSIEEESVVKPSEKLMDKFSTELHPEKLSDEPEDDPSEEKVTEQSEECTENPQEESSEKEQLMHQSMDQSTEPSEDQSTIKSTEQSIKQSSEPILSKDLEIIEKEKEKSSLASSTLKLSSDSSTEQILLQFVAYDEQEKTKLQQAIIDQTTQRLSEQQQEADRLTNKINQQKAKLKEHKALHRQLSHELELKRRQSAELRLKLTSQFEINQKQKKELNYYKEMNTKFMEENRLLQQQIRELTKIKFSKLN